MGTWGVGGLGGFFQGGFFLSLMCVWFPIADEVTWVWVYQTGKAQHRLVLHHCRAVMPAPSLTKAVASTFIVSGDTALSRQQKKQQKAYCASKVLLLHFLSCTSDMSARSQTRAPHRARKKLSVSACSKTNPLCTSDWSGMVHILTKACQGVRKL